MTGYKKVLDINDIYKQYILELDIPDDAIIFYGADSTKGRCNKATVVSMTTLEGGTVYPTKSRSMYSDGWEYEVGTMAVVPNFDTTSGLQCSQGIHFWKNRWQAVDMPITEEI